ncbi:MAG: SufE family protein [Alphaproteobacteria bacterium]
MISMTGHPDIDAIQDEIIDEFALFDDWQERYRYLIDLGRKLPPYPEEFRTDDYLVRGCQSRVWLHARTENGLLHFDAASDAAIVSGLIVLLLRIFSGQPPLAISRAEPRFVTAVGLGEHLSPSRSNGLAAMIKTIKSIAAAQR